MLIKLTKPQMQFVKTDSKFPAFVAGYRSGKSFAAACRIIRLKIENPHGDVAYYLPTYDLIERIAYPTFAEVFEMMEVGYTIQKQAKVINVENMGDIILRTMDRPERIVGYSVTDSIADELDTIPADKAGDIWRKIVSRNSKPKLNGKPNTVAVATTPEGFKFVYDNWQRNPMAGSELIRASTWSNYKNIHPDYIQSLYDTYPAHLLNAYVEGEFINLKSSTVYAEYDRARHHTSDTIQPNDALHIGMDFNVGKMAAVIHVLRDNKPRAVMEYGNILDTPAMIAMIKSRHPNHSILVYPDASGGSRKSVNASESDLSLLRQAGFSVLVNSRNPAVKDRVLSVNAMFKSNNYLVNVDLCPNYVESLEKQAYDKNGEPDKTSGHDHMNDAGSYCICYRYPILKDDVVKFKLKGL